jgi:hypothetical protein
MVNEVTYCKLEKKLIKHLELVADYITNVPVLRKYSITLMYLPPV